MGVRRKRCRVCKHDDVDRMEIDLTEGRISPEELDEKYSWPSGSSARHIRNHMGEFYDNSNPKCKICISPDRPEIELALHEGKMTLSDIAEEMSISKEQIWKHMNKHLKPLVQKSAATEIARREVNEIDMLSTNVQRLDEKITELFTMSHLGSKEIDSLTKLAREIRESLKYLLEFKGKFVHKRQDTVIVAQMQIVQEVLAQNHPQVWLDVKDKMERKMQ